MSNLILEISKLSIADRVQLIQEILGTISKDSGYPSDPDLTEKQMEEIDRRWEAIESGEAKTVSWDSIEEKLKQRYEL